MEALNQAGAPETRAQRHRVGGRASHDGKEEKVTGMCVESHLSTEPGIKAESEVRAGGWGSCNRCETTWGYGVSWAQHILSRAWGWGEADLS